MKKTAVTTTNTGTSLVLNNGSEFTETELATIKEKLNGDLKIHLEVMNKQYLELDVAGFDLDQEIKRAERRLKDTKEYQTLMKLKQDRKLVRARLEELRTKAHGILEAALGSVRRGTKLYQKLAMRLAAGEQN